MMTGDGTVVARVASMVNPAGYAGLMIRETLAPESKAAEVDFSNGGSGFRLRGTTFTGIGGWGGPGSLSLPYWLKLVRSAGNFSGYISADGITWVQVGNTSAVSMTDPVYVGALLVTDDGSRSIWRVSYGGK
jgi:hypothetical protein